MSTIKEKYLNDLLKNNEGIKILNKKFSTIITDKDFYKYGLLTQIIQTLIKNGYTQTIFDNFNLILSSSLTDETFDILLLIKSIPNSNQLFFNNIEEIYLKLEGEEILEFIELLDKSKQDEIFKKNEFSYNLYKEGFIRESTLGNIIKGDLSIFIEELIKEVSEGKKLESLEAGTYNDAILTNDYVIKLGETRDKFEIPYHPNILQPLLRERIKDKNGKVIKTREYYFRKYNPKEDKYETYVIQDHSAGHEKGNQGPHFNVRPIENRRNGDVIGTKQHYPFKK